MSAEAANLLMVIGAMVLVGTLGLTSLVIHNEMVEQVNRRLPASEQFVDAWWRPEKTGRLFREYRRLYPDGPLLRRQWILFGIAIFIIASLFAWMSLP